jgi:hypothetical protein
MIERRQHKYVPLARSFRGADSDIDHCLVAAKFGERLSVRKLATQVFDVEERFNPKNLKEVEGKEKY